MAHCRPSGSGRRTSAYPSNSDIRLCQLSDAPGRGELLAEMQAFAQVAVGRRGPKMEASRGHDDLVLALALVAFAAALVRHVRAPAAALNGSRGI